MLLVLQNKAHLNDLLAEEGGLVHGVSLLSWVLVSTE